MSRSNNKEWFYVPPARCWDLFCASLQEVVGKYQAHVYSFVLMSNHFHLIIGTPQGNLGAVMRDFLTATSKLIQREANRINHVFGQRYKWSLLASAYSVAYVYKYVLRNPIRANLSDLVESHPYSSIHANAASTLPLVSGLGPLWSNVPSNRMDQLRWLNMPTPRELEAQISRGLRRQTFRFSKDNNQQPNVRKLREMYAVENVL